MKKDPPYHFWVDMTDLFYFKSLYIWIDMTGFFLNHNNDYPERGGCSFRKQPYSTYLFGSQEIVFSLWFIMRTIFARCLTTITTAKMTWTILIASASGCRQI